MAAKRRAALVGIMRAMRDMRRPGAPGFGERLAALPRLVGATLSGRYRGSSPGRLGLFALGLIYILSPIDLAPEALLTVFGLADDALVGVWLLGNVLDETERFISWEKEQARYRVVPGEVIDDRR